MVDKYSLDECCGCGLCEQVCPKKAIRIEKDEFGFDYPKVDYSKCISCGVCLNKCFFKKEHEEKEITAKCFIANHKVSETSLRSSSGGCFSVICEALVATIGNVKYSIYGAVWNKDFSVSHERVTNINEIDKFRKSKYVQSQLKNTFCQVKEDLENSYFVIYSGTPCQIDALYSYLGKRSIERLYTIDLVCNGVASPRAFQKYMRDYWPHASSVDMRYKKPYHNTMFLKWFRIELPNKIQYERMNYFTSAYYCGVFNRESCFNCPYARKERVGDFSLGDTHTSYECMNSENYKTGSSILIFNSEKAQNLITICETYCYMTEIPYKDAYSKSARLLKSCKKPLDYPTLLRNVLDDNSDTISEIKKNVAIIPMWKQKLGEAIPEVIWNMIKK